MIQEVTIIDLIHAALGKEEFYMALQFFTARKYLLQAHHDLALFFGQLVRMFRIHGREIHVLHGIFFAVQCNDLPFEIDPVQQHPVFHMELGVTHDQLPLQLELQNGNCLMHLGIQSEVLGIVIGVELDGKGIAVGIFVSLQCKGGKRQQVDAVTILQGGEIAVSGRHADHVGNACQASRRSAHPHHVMIAPLDIHGMVLTQGIHDDMGTGSSVIDVSDDMKVINDQPLDQVA